MNLKLIGLKMMPLEIISDASYDSNNPYYEVKREIKMKTYEQLVNEASAKFTRYCNEYQKEFMDIEIPCMVADCVPSLITIIEEQQKEIERLTEENASLDGIGITFEKAQEKINKLQQRLDAKIMFVSNGTEEDMYVLQEKVIEQQKEIEQLKKRYSELDEQFDKHLNECER